MEKELEIAALKRKIVDYDIIREELAFYQGLSDTYHLKREELNRNNFNNHQYYENLRNSLYSPRSHYDSYQSPRNDYLNTSRRLNESYYEKLRRKYNF